MSGRLLAVVGARGGVGATTFAATLAEAAGAVLVDVDGLSGGIDVSLGCEQARGVRWSGLQLAGGSLAAADLVAALPCHGSVPVLAADVASGPSSSQVEQVLDVLAGTPVVVDLPRRLDPVTHCVMRRCALIVLLVPASVPGAAAARAVVTALPEQVAVGLVVRGCASGAAALAEATGRPLLAVAADLASATRAAAGVAAAVRT